MAMLDDWTELANGVKGTGPLAASQEVEVILPVLPGIATTEPGTAVAAIPPPVSHPKVAVPLWLLPALSSKALAEQLVAAGLMTIVPQVLQTTVNIVAKSNGACVPAAPVPPGYAGLLTQIIQGVAVPQLTDDFLPLIQSSLKAKATSLGVSYQPGQGMSNVTLYQLATHTSAIPDGFTDTAVLTTIPSAITVQPTNGGPVTCDIWAYLLAFVSQPANGQSGYKNDDYNVLGGVIAACTGTDYDDYVYARLFSDPQFSALRRYVTNVANSADYYSGLGPNFSAGNPFPDFRGWGASGGFYYTADQITQWMYTLYTGASVQRITGAGPSGPLVSQAALAVLFGRPAGTTAGPAVPPAAPTALFVAGASNNVSGWTTYTHNGATGVGSGSCNGDMGIAVAPNGDVITAFFCANGSLGGNAPFNAALANILQYSYPPSTS